MESWYEGTYEREPATKVRALATGGKDLIKLEPRLESDPFDTTYLLQKIFEDRNKHGLADLVYS